MGPSKRAVVPARATVASGMRGTDKCAQAKAWSVPVQVQRGRWDGTMGWIRGHREQSDQHRAGNDQVMSRFAEICRMRSCWSDSPDWACVRKMRTFLMVRSPKRKEVGRHLSTGLS